MALTIRQKRFARNVAVGMSLKEAAAKAGYSKARAAITGSQQSHRPHVLAEINYWLEKYGLGKANLCKELKRGLRNGRYGSHHSYLETGLKLHGLLGPIQETNPQPINIAVLQQVHQNAVEGGLYNDKNT